MERTLSTRGDGAQALGAGSAATDRRASDPRWRSEARRRRAGTHGRATPLRAFSFAQRHVVTPVRSSRGRGLTVPAELDRAGPWDMRVEPSRVCPVAAVDRACKTQNRRRLLVSAGGRAPALAGDASRWTAARKPPRRWRKRGQMFQRRRTLMAGARVSVRTALGLEGPANRLGFARIRALLYG